MTIFPCRSCKCGKCPMCGRYDFDVGGGLQYILRDNYGVRSVGGFVEHP